MSLFSLLGDVSMATFSTPVPPPVKNDWLPVSENTGMSPPSPGGQRKPVTPSMVRTASLLKSIWLSLIPVYRVPQLLAEAHHQFQQLVDLLPKFQADLAVLELLQFQAIDQQADYLLPLFHREYHFYQFFIFSTKPFYPRLHLWLLLTFVLPLTIFFLSFINNVFKLMALVLDSHHILYFLIIIFIFSMISILNLPFFSFLRFAYVPFLFRFCSVYL